MSMTKKHFETIATTIKAHRDKARDAALATGFLSDAEPVLAAIDGLAAELGARFTKFHPLFDRGRFLRVAGYDPTDYAEDADDDTDLAEAA